MLTLCYVPSLRTYWIVDMSWTADGLFLAAMTKRGCLLVLPRFGPPLRLVSSGCSMDMGPLMHLPLHPLITIMYVHVHVHVHACTRMCQML